MSKLWMSSKCQNAGDEVYWSHVSQQVATSTQHKEGEKVKIVRKYLPRFTLRRQWHCLITRHWTWWSAWLGLKKGARRELEREGGDTAETWRRRPRSWLCCFQSCEPATRHWRQSLSPLSPWSAKKALIEILIKVWHHKLMKHNDQPWIFEWTSA